MVSVYTIDGEVTLDTAPFDDAIEKLVTKLDSLKEGLSSLGVNTRNFQSELGVASNEMSNLETGASSFKNRLAESLNEMGQLNNQTGNIKNTMSEINGDMRNFASETGVAQSNVAKTTAELTKQREVLATVKNEISTISAEMGQFRFDRNLISDATVQGFTHITQKNREIGETIRANTDLYHQQEQVHQADLSIQADIVARLQRQGEENIRNLEIERNRLQNHRNMVSQMQRLANEFMKIERAENRQLTYEQEQLAVEKEFQTVIAQEMYEKEQLMRTQDASLKLEQEILALMGDKVTMTGEEIAEETKKINSLRQELDLQKQILNLEKEQTAQESIQTKERMTGNATGTGSKVNKLDQVGNMPRRIGSMVVAMWGFNEVMDVYEKTMEDVNAKSELAYFGKRLNMTGKEMNTFTKQLENLQHGYKKANGEFVKGYQKVDMKMVGASALDTARKYKVQKDNVDELTEVMAIYGSEFVRQGRTQEDSILAVNDALDGELRRLKEVGIGQDELKKHGWKGEGDTEGMVKALKEIADERGYTETAKDITNLSDAITTAELELSFLLSDLFELAEPSLVYALKQLISLFGWLGEGVRALKGYLQGLPKPWKDFLKMFGGNALLGLGGLLIGKKIVGFLSGFDSLGKAWTKLMERLGRTKGIEKATETFGKFEKTTTGGTVGNGKNVGFKEGFKEGIQGLGKNLGTMAKVFVELAVALAMAFALIEEALVLISGIGATYDALKPQFDSGIKFIQEFGIWIWGASAVLIAFMGILGKFGQGLDTSMISGGKTMAIGIGLALGLIAEAIGLLILPLGAIALLGAFQGWQEENISKGIGVIRMFGNALNELANNDALVIFLGAFVVISAILGVSGGTAILPLAIGIASTLGLVALAIGMLVAPLGAIALLGVTYGALGEENINKGAEVITLVGNCLKALEPAVRNLLAVDMEVFGVALVDLATKLATGGKDGITALSEDIIPKFVTFAKKINEMEIPSEIGSDKITALTTIANQIPPLYRALQSVNTALATSDAVGNVGGAIGGSISNAVGMGLQGKLDQIYNDSKAIMDWATKMSSLNGSNGTGGASAVTQVAQVIVDLKTKLAQMSATISASASSIQTSATQLGRSIITGWKSGSASFGATVVQTVANGVRAVQNRYNTMANGGRTLGNKLSSGFNSHSPKLVTIVSNEIQYALWECDANEQNFYDRGAKLGRALSDGFESEKGMNVGSPARIARAIAQEMIYSKNAIDLGTIMMYRGGQALGSALANGYADSQLKTNIGMLTQTGVSNEEITNAQTRKPPIQAQQGQGNQTIINLTFTGNIYGIEDLENTMRNIADKVFIEYNDINPNIGG